MGQKMIILAIFAILVFISGCTNTQFYPEDLKQSFSTDNLSIKEVSVGACTDETFTANVSGTVYLPFGSERIRCEIEESAGSNNFSALEIRRGSNDSHIRNFLKSPIVQRTYTEPLTLCCQIVSRQDFDPIGENFCIEIEISSAEQENCPLIYNGNETEGDVGNQSPLKPPALPEGNDDQQIVDGGDRLRPPSLPS
ncbi:MAG: hypothetical protein ABIH20_02735 [Candidatus Diapherotrites archaeon]